MSKTIAKIVEVFATIVTSPMNAKRRTFTRCLASERLGQTVSVDFPDGPLLFNCPTARAAQDPVNFFGNEPETRRWIDRFSPGDVFWDIGANIGIFSIYAAKKIGVEVFAFEPSAATFATLARNVELNGVGERVRPLCLALSDKTQLDFLHMENTGSGHATHAFGQLQTIDKELRPTFSQAVPGIAADDFVSIFNQPKPTHIKLDVDSIEERIIKGGAGVFGSAKTVMVEAYNLARDPQVETFKALEALGLKPDQQFNEGNFHNFLFINPSV